MSQNNTQKAAKGSQEAMQALYDAHKTRVMKLCQALLLDENEADHATAHIFKKTFEEVAADRVTTDEEFSKLLFRKTVLYCKAKILKKSNRAFRVPAGSNFVYTYERSNMDLSGTPEIIILKNLPAFLRFIYVLYHGTAYSTQEISRIFNTTPKVIAKALDAEPVNIARIAAVLAKRGVAASNFSIDSFLEMLTKDTADVMVPSSVDATVRLHIEAICKPILEKAKRKRMSVIAVVATVLVVIGFIAALAAVGSEDSGVDLDNADLDTEASTVAEDSVEVTSELDEAQEDSSVEEATDVEATHYADIEIGNYGTITVALDGNAAPETVANFVSLAQSGFYDGLTFHRIIDGFMMQGGDPNGDGTGGNMDKDGNEINITGEFSANGYDNPLSHTAGAISMARADDYNSGSSQFFIVHTDDYTDSLDGLYACFGYVTEGMEIVEAICTEAEPTDDNGTISAEDQPVITSITIREVSETDSGESTDSSDMSSIETDSSMEETIIDSESSAE